MKVVIIDYGSGNLHSAAKAFERMAERTGHRVDVVTNAHALKTADHIVLPGVGAFGDCKTGLESVPGMVDALEAEVIEKKKPFLGICVGMQLLADIGLERGEHQGLGWINGEVTEIRPKDIALRIPHMGWNTLKSVKAHPIFSGIKEGDHAYFVHSYQLQCDKENMLAQTDYGEYITAAVGKENIVGTQFHPEKSQETGLRLIENFLKWDGS